MKPFPHFTHNHFTNNNGIDTESRADEYDDFDISITQDDEQAEMDRYEALLAFQDAQEGGRQTVTMKPKVANKAARKTSAGIVPAKANAARAGDEPIEDENSTGPLAGFFADEMIVGSPSVVKSGKEASVYCCRAHPRLGERWLAAKVYRPRQQRSFKNDGVYQQGRTSLDARLDRAIAGHTRKGLEAQFQMWIGAEYATLRSLHAAGADVPEPFGMGESAILLEYFGAPGHAAPQLHNVRLEDAEVRPLFEQMVRNLKIFMECDRVHGDLSPYNILYWQGELQIIDFPQAVDPMDNPQAYGLWLRDVQNVCAYFAEYGLESDDDKLAFSLWVGSGRAAPTRASRAL